MHRVALLALTVLLSLGLTAAEIRTPGPGPKPRITGATQFGVRPDHPILHRLTATGTAPLTFAIAGFPAELTCDPATGALSGTLSKPGRYDGTVTVSNAEGSATRKFSLVVGEDLLLTPPLGWNSWYCFSEGVSQAKISTTAKGMVSRGLAQHGWSYINIDDCWQGERAERCSALQPNERFPDMKALCDEVHALGLKIGIYSTPWMSTYAGFRGGSIDSKDAHLKPILPEDKRRQANQIYGTWPGKLNLVGRTGDIWLLDTDIAQWATWGFDYVKFDWLPNDVPTTKRIADALRAQPRDIVLSLSNNAPAKSIPELSNYAQLWRTTGDIHDAWGSFMGNIRKNDKVAATQRPGHWNDPDMLQVGAIGTAGSLNKTYRPTRLSPNECYTQVSLWAISAAPLFVSCDLAGMDDFTYALLTNDELIDIHQDPLGLQGICLRDKDGLMLRSKPLASGEVALSITNTTDKPCTYTFSCEDFKLKSVSQIRDVWRQKDLPQPVTLTIEGHSTEVLRVAL